MNKIFAIKDRLSGKCILVLGLCFLFSVQAISCTTLGLSKKQGMGQIENARAHMDGIDRLFFVVPELVVFVVDFHEKAVYLPPLEMSDNGSQVDDGLGQATELQKVTIEADRLEAKVIEGIVEAGTGRRVHLEDDDLLIIAYKEPVDIGDTFLRLGREYGIPAIERLEVEKPFNDSVQNENTLADL